MIVTSILHIKERKGLIFETCFFLFYKIIINILKHDSNDHSYNNDNMDILYYIL